LNLIPRGKTAKSLPVHGRISFIDRRIMYFMSLALAIPILPNSIWVMVGAVGVCPLIVQNALGKWHMHIGVAFRPRPLGLSRQIKFGSILLRDVLHPE